MRRGKKYVLIFLIILACGLASGIFFWLKPRGEAKGDRYFESFRSLLKPLNPEEMNIILFTIDTLRADHLQCYGYERVRTPNINRLAEEGILFEECIAQTPLTLPSHSSIFTGTFPLFHGVRDNGGFYLDESHLTLAEALKLKGYTTGGFVAAFVLDSRWGLDQGFDYYFDNFDLTKYKSISLDSVQRRGDEVLEETKKWLEENLGQKFFTWIHLYDPHTPYDPPEPYKSEYEGLPFGLYDGEIAYVDQLIGEFRQYLENKKVWEKTIIIFTSDHGESLGEHKESAHGFFIYDCAIRVPLIIRLPQEKLKGRVIREQVRSVDLMPSILSMVGGDVPESVQGESFLPLILEREKAQRGKNLSAYSETYWPRYHYGWSELKSLRKGGYKFIDAPKPELYDLSKDPKEVNNLVNKEASLAHEMKRELMSLIGEYSAEGIENLMPKKLDDDSLIKLQALGYIGSFRAASKKGEKLADPKDKIELYNEIKVAQFLVTEEKMEEAEKKIRDVLEKDPSVLEARYILGNIYSRQNKHGEAIEEYKKALEVDPEYYEAVFGLALAYHKAGKIEEAILGFKRLIDMDPKDTKPYLHLGNIYEERGEIDEAIKYLKIASELDPEAPIFHNNLGALYLQKGMLELAEKEIKSALSIERSIPLQNAHFNMALLHEARGEIQKAIEEYNREKEVSPYNHKPYFNLGLIYAKSNRVEMAIKEFEGAIERNEKFPDAYVFLAKAYMDSGKDLEEAERLALKGLELKPGLKVNILAHFVLADIYNRMGRIRDSELHVSKARELQKTLSD